jgi:hypothetical protein
MAIVPAKEFVELDAMAVDAMAVYGMLTQAIRLHARNLNELRKTRNLRFANLGAPPRVAFACRVCLMKFAELSPTEQTKRFLAWIGSWIASFGTGRMATESFVLPSAGQRSATYEKRINSFDHRRNNPDRRPQT